MVTFFFTLFSLLVHRSFTSSFSLLSLPYLCHNYSITVLPVYQCQRQNHCSLSLSHWIGVTSCSLYYQSLSLGDLSSLNRLPPHRSRPDQASEEGVSEMVDVHDTDPPELKENRTVKDKQFPGEDESIIK